MTRLLTPFRVLLIVVALLLPAPARSQPAASCGVVDSLRFPINSEREQGGDFGMFRQKFGGLHTGVDIAFYEYGSPVYAIANGRVTYADPEGWDTEKGVVIIEHTFPDGSLFYSLYGHMEPIGDYFFPGVGQCVRPGDVVGAVGRPTLSAPHLHFEIRDFGPDDGGPGYWDVNPLLAGWEHPLDFLRRWQARLQSVDGRAPFLSSVSALNPPSVPPIVTAEGGLVLAGANLLEGIGPEGDLQWRMELSGTITGLLQLKDGRVLVRSTPAGSTESTITLLRDGRFTGVWTPALALVGGPYPLDNGLVAFLTADNALAGYTPEGALVWLTPALGDRINQVVTDGTRVAVSTNPRAEGAAPAWRVVDHDGQWHYQVAPANPAYAALSPAGDAFLLDGATLYHISAEYIPTPIARLPQAAGRSTALAADSAGNAYVFMALEEAVLYSYAPDGSPRWSVALPGTHRQPPLLAAGRGCLFYALAADGTLYALDARQGTILGQTSLYTGGANGQPNARLLSVRPDAEMGGERVQIGAGFLTVATFDGYALAGVAPGVCPE